MTFAVKADATQSATSAAGDELNAPCNRGKCRETRLTARRLPCSCEGLASEANLKIAERGEDKADAQQGTRLKAARHFPQIRKHCIRHATHADACAPFGFGFAESTLRFASAHFPHFPQISRHIQGDLKTQRIEAMHAARRFFCDMVKLPP